MSAALNLAAVQSNLRQLGHDVSEETIVHMLKDLDLSRLLGQLPPQDAATADASAQMQQSKDGSSTRAASDDAVAASERCGSETAEGIDAEHSSSTCSSLRNDSRGSSSSSQSFSDNPVDKPQDRQPYAYDFSAGSSTSFSGSRGRYSICSSDVSNAQTQTPDPDGMSDGSSISPDQDEEDDDEEGDDGGYYLSSRTADLVGARQPPACSSARALSSKPGAIRCVSCAAGETAAAGAEWQCRRTVRCRHVGRDPHTNRWARLSLNLILDLQQDTSLQTWALESQG